MGRFRRDDEYVYAVPGVVWEASPEEVVGHARELAAEKGMAADGEPEVHVLLVWPQVNAQAPSTRFRVA